MRFSRFLTTIIIGFTIQGFSQESEFANEANRESSSDTATIIKQLVTNWNKAHNNKDIELFSEIFDNSVMFYQTQMEKEVCLDKKRQLFEKYPTLNNK